MKLRKIGLFVFIATLILSLAACSSQPKTLESYLEKDADAKQQIEDVATQSNMQVDITENTITYTYDISNLNSALTEEMAKSDEIKTAMSDALDGTASTFTSLCSQIEEETKISGVKMVVKYLYKDYLIVEREFSAE